MFRDVVKSGLIAAGVLAGTAFAASESVELSTMTGKLYGTLEVPSGKGPFTLVIIHAGSGPTDRDGNSPAIPGKNNSLKLLAEGLAHNGIASLRYDKRGIAQSAAAGSKEEDLRFENYINDLASWLERMRKDNRFNRFVIAGHSEGSLIGMLAAQKAKADAYISIAGPGRPADQLIVEQLEANKANPAALISESKTILTELKAGRTVAKVSPVLAALFRPSVQPYLISWFRYDPAAEIAKLTVPVLIVQGSTDIQVSLKDSELLAAANPKAKRVVITGMNHIFKTAPADMQGNLATYSDPNLPLAPGFLDAIVSFVK